MGGMKKKKILSMDELTANAVAVVGVRAAGKAALASPTTIRLLAKKHFY